MDQRWLTTYSFWGLTFLLAISSGAAAADSQSAEHHKGVTVDQLTRGVRSAAQNIEKEIPKIGPAVGKTLKSIGANRSDKTRTQESSPGKQ